MPEVRGEAGTEGPRLDSWPPGRETTGGGGLKSHSPWGLVTCPWETAAACVASHVMADAGVFSMTLALPRHLLPLGRAPGTTDCSHGAPRGPAVSPAPCHQQPVTSTTMLPPLL